MKKLLTTALTASLTAGLLAGAVALAPVAAACGESSIINGELCDKTTVEQNKTTTTVVKPPKDPNPGDPNPGPGETTTTTTFDRVSRWGGSLWFWDYGKTVDLGGTTGGAGYDRLYDLAQCAAPRGYANPSLGGVTLNARAGYYYTETEQWMWVDVDGVKTETLLRTVYVNHRYCRDYSTPTERDIALSQIADMRIQGPFDSDGQPMRGEDLNGKLTRTSPTTGQPSVDGDLLTGLSRLGNVIQTRVGSEQAVKTTPATVREAYEQSIKTGEDLELFKARPEVLSDHGRYVGVQHIWQSHAHAYFFTDLSEYVADIYPGMVAAEKYVRYWPTSYGGAPVYIDRVTGPKEERQVVRFTITCKSTKGTGDLFAYTLVDGPKSVSPWTGMDDSWAGGMPSQVSGGWGDGPTTYTYQCGEDPKVDDPPAPKGKDFLYCGTYNKTITQSRQSAAITGYTDYYSCEIQYGGSNLRWDGDHWSWDCPGGTGGGGQWGVNVCRRGGTCSRWVENAGPSGWSREGSVWREPCPAGWTTVSSTTCEKTEESTVYVDGKQAAPLEKATIDIDGKVSELPRRADGSYEVGAFADHVRFQWERPKATVAQGSASGKNVNALPGSSDVRWERMWKVDLSGSPLLKSGADRKGPPTVASINDPAAPVHGWTDRTAETDNDTPDESLQWIAAQERNDSASWSRWAGFDRPDANLPGWEDTQRSLFIRLFQTQNYGFNGWKLTPYYRVTATLPNVTFDEFVGVTVDSQGNLAPVTERVTKDVRDSYVCPAQPVTLNSFRVVG